MQGLDAINERTREQVNKIMLQVYGAGLYDPNQIEDIILMTDKRDTFPPLGTDRINMSSLIYILSNIYWINICLYVNDDFRSCFDDAIAIEKALLRVNDQEYADFRDDMTLDDDAFGGPSDKSVSINLANYKDDYALSCGAKLDKAKIDFYSAGMTDVYNDLANSFDADGRAGVMHVISNMVYVVNSFNRNGVFRKYVTLVVDSVKKQLS